MKRLECEKRLTPWENAKAMAISKKVDILEDTARLLCIRGIDTEKKAEHYLYAGKEYFIDPFMLKGVKECVERITLAKERKETVLVFGDYDADGISATLITYFTLRDFGIIADTFVPERADGYGLTETSLNKLNKKYDLIITVDCGIGSHDIIEEIKKSGTDVIVTDHHELPSTLPETIIINPKLSGQEYPYDNLCGAGVAFKISSAILGEKANEYLDFAALATIADSMLLTGENRDIVKEGIKLFNSEKMRLQFKYLLADTNSVKSITASNIAFYVSPRINAAGRMGNANLALELFLTEDSARMLEIAKELNNLNSLRQAECDKLYNSAKAQLLEQKPYDRVICLYDGSWPAGIVGIVASKLCEEYYRPVILFTDTGNGVIKGSARSIDGVNIFEGIESVKDLTVEHGGHAQAAGVAIKIEDFEKFKVRLNEFLLERYTDEIYTPLSTYDMELTEKVPLKFAEEIELLEPFGLGNKKPKFLMELNKNSEVSPIKSDSPHLKIVDERLEFMHFYGLDNLDYYKLPCEKKVLFELNLSEFRGKVQLKGFVKELNYKIDKNISLKRESFFSSLENILLGEKDCKEISKAEVERYLLDEKARYGKIFAISNLDNLKYYPTLADKQIEYKKPTCKNLLNVLLLSPSNYDFAGYEKVIFLDKPVYKMPSATAEVLVREDILSFDLEELDTSRQNLGRIYKIISFFKGESVNSFTNIIDFSQELKRDELNSALAIAVFKELRLIDIKDDTLILSGIKCNLDDSAILRRVNELKGE